MSADISIRPVTPADVNAVAALARHIWQTHFPGIISQAQIDYMVDQRYQPQQIVDALDRVGVWWDQLFVGDTLAAFAVYQLGSAPGEMKLAQLYVHPDQQHRGYGGMLLTHVADQARQQGCHTLVLSVNKRNGSALAAYSRYGFTVREAVQVDIGGGFTMDDYIMARPL